MHVEAGLTITISSTFLLNGWSFTVVRIQAVFPYLCVCAFNCYFPRSLTCDPPLVLVPQTFRWLREIYTTFQGSVRKFSTLALINVFYHIMFLVSWIQLILDTRLRLAGSPFALIANRTMHTTLCFLCPRPCRGFDRESFFSREVRGSGRGYKLLPSR